MAMAGNIKKLRKIFGVTQSELARIAGVTENAVSKWENGYADPRMGAIEKMAACYGLSKMNIIEDGGMDLIDPVTKKQRPTEFDHIAYQVVSSVEVPVLGKVHAGELMEHDEVDDTTRIPDFVAAQSPNVFVVHSEGDCMDKDFSVNDDLVVNPDKEPINGSVVIAFIDGAEYIVRRIFRTAQTLILSPNSHNPEYKDIVITADSDTTVEIGGVVIWNQARRLLD